MPLTITNTGKLKRGRGRPSTADREFERRLRAAAAADLARTLDPVLDDIDSQFVVGTRRYRRGPPALTGRSLKFIGLVASGMSEDAARVVCKLQQRAIRRLLTNSPAEASVWESVSSTSLLVSLNTPRISSLEGGGLSSGPGLPASLLRMSAEE